MSGFLDDLFGEKEPELLEVSKGEPRFCLNQSAQQQQQRQLPQELPAGSPSPQPRSRPPVSLKQTFQPQRSLSKQRPAPLLKQRPAPLLKQRSSQPLFRAPDNTPSAHSHGAPDSAYPHGAPDNTGPSEPAIAPTPSLISTEALGREKVLFPFRTFNLMQTECKL